MLHLYLLSLYVYFIMKERILQLIQEEAQTNAEFADKIGISTSSLSHILTGRNKPSLDVVMHIHKAYPTINLDWLLYGEGDMKRKWIRMWLLVCLMKIARIRKLRMEIRFVLNFARKMRFLPLITYQKILYKKKLNTSKSRNLKSLKYAYSSITVLIRFSAPKNLNRKPFCLSVKPQNVCIWIEVNLLSLCKITNLPQFIL